MHDRLRDLAADVSDREHHARYRRQSGSGDPGKTR